MARLHPKPYEGMPPSSDLIYEIEHSLAAIQEKIKGNLDLEVGEVKGAFIEVSGTGVRPDRFARRRERQTAYYFVLKEVPLTFQWVPVSGHPPLPARTLEPWKRRNIEFQLEAQRHQARLAKENNL